MQNNPNDLTKKQEFSVLHPKIQATKNFFVPSSFEDRLKLHIIKTALPELDPPLMLLIQGPKGEGKSAMTRELCSRMGVYVISISGALLSGSFEKEPIYLLHEAYLHASSMRRSTKSLAILLIDDLDTSVASIHDDRRYTVNTQLLNGALMGICDTPTVLGETATFRIPIIATGNDFTTLHEPLTRHGRAFFFDWNPTIEEKVDIVTNLFHDILNTSELQNVHLLVNHFSNGYNQPVSFYKDLKQTLFDEDIIASIHNSPKIDLPRLSNMVASRRDHIRIDDLISFGEKLSMSKPRRFLSN